MERTSVAILVDWPELSAALDAALPERQFEIVPLQGVESLHEALHARWFDVLVIEDQLQSFFSGMDIVERIQRELLHPKTVLLAEPTDKNKRAARELGVSRLLSDMATAEEVAEVVRELAEESRASRVKIRPEARAIVEQVKEIAPLPQLLVKLTPYLMMAEEELSLTDLASDVAVDPKLTADLLAYVNSAAFGVAQTVSSVRDAVALLGVRRTISSVLAARTIHANKQLTQSALGKHTIWYHKRCILIASASFAFAKHFTDVAEETAYVLGLLQEVGISGFACALGTRYEQVIARFRQTGPLRLEVLESTQYRANHAEVSAAMLERWGLQEALVAPVRDHHTSQEHARRGRTEQKFLDVMQAAEAFANLMDGHLAQRFPLFLRLFADLASDDVAAMRQALHEAVEKAAESGEIFRIPVPERTEMDQLIKAVVDNAVEYSQK